MGTVLQPQEVVRNLGLYVDSRLKFSNHVSGCIQRAYMALKLLYSCRHFLNRGLRSMLCNQLVLSCFDYCDVVYGPFLDKFDSSRIQSVQNRCCRLVLDLRRSVPTSSYINSLKWLNMNNRRKLHFMCFVHKIIKLKQPSYLYRKINFRHNIHSVNIRDQSNVDIPRHYTAKFNSSFSYQAPHIYNSIDSNIKIRSMSGFRLHIKNLILFGQVSTSQRI